MLSANQRMKTMQRNRPSLSPARNYTSTINSTTTNMLTTPQQRNNEHHQHSPLVSTPLRRVNTSSLPSPSVSPSVSPSLGFTAPLPLHSIFSRHDPFNGNGWNRTPSPTSSTSGNPIGTPKAQRDWGRKDGVHWWFGCGRMKNSIAKMSSEISKLRKEIVQQQLQQLLPMHPEIWIAENKPSHAALNARVETRVSDADAQR